MTFSHVIYLEFCLASSLLHMGDWSFHNLDAYAVLYCVGTVDPPICQTARIFLSHISLESYQCDLRLIKQWGGPYAHNLILKIFTFERRNGECINMTT